MGYETAQEIVAGYDRLKSKRGVWESHWQEAAERVWPPMAEMTGWKTSGEKRSERIFDSTAQRALPRFAAAMDSLLTPATQKWHTLHTGIPELDQKVSVQRWCEAIRDLLFRRRYAPTANFASQAFECYMSLGCFGNNCLFIDELVGTGIRYRSIPLSEIAIDLDHQGRVNLVYRCFLLSARAAVKVPGWQALMPAEIKDRAAKSPDDTFEFIHCVRPNDEARPGMAGPEGMGFASTYVMRQQQHVMERSGYRTMPYAVGRYVTGAREIYGRGPAMECLADNKSLQEQEKTLLRVAHRMVDPPLLLVEDASLSPFGVRPNSLNYGYLREDGKPLVQALQIDGKIPIGIEMADQKRKAINDSFLVTLFQILVEEPGVKTATEIMQRAQEKGQLLGPTMGRQQSEFLGPTIDREIDVMSVTGELPEPPAELMDYLMSGGEILPKYTGPLALLMKAEEAAGILRTVEGVAPLLQAAGDLKPLRRLNMDVAVQILAEANGVPARAMRTDEELEAIDEDEKQQAQAQQLLEAAPLAGQAAEHFAKAEQIGASVPRRGVPAPAP